MEKILSKDPILEKIVNGTASDEVLELFVGKNLPLREEEYLEGLIILINNSKFGEKASNCFKELNSSVKLGYVTKKEANHNVVRHILADALDINEPEIVFEVINNQSLPGDLLKKIGEQGSLNMLEVLVENQIKMIAYPEIMEAAENNENANGYVKGKINEIREFYLSDNEVELISEDDVLEDLKDIMSSLEMSDILRDVDGGETIEDMIVEEKALTALQKINNLKLPQKVRLALEGNKTERMILLRDPSKVIVKAVLDSPKISESEILIFLNIKSIDKEFIEKIAKNKEWTRKYPIVLGLVKNPKSPVSQTMSMVKKLHIRDLKILAKDRNANPVIRKFAFNLMQQRDGVK
ncbi:MAG: hypothetical protein ABFR75_04250 [Acidobacteriota bacterium]